MATLEFIVNPWLSFCQISPTGAGFGVFAPDAHISHAAATVHVHPPGFVWCCGYTGQGEIPMEPTNFNLWTNVNSVSGGPHRKHPS